MTEKHRRSRGFLDGSAVYLSGPMDFVASREAEKTGGWRHFIRQILEPMGVLVYDPWDKPKVIGLHQYGVEDVGLPEHIRNTWTFAPGDDGDRARAHCAGEFWSSLHIDLRMVDKSDFLIAYCPTNVYSVGTVHEIVTARVQRKPVLFVSPRFELPALDRLRAHLVDDPLGQGLLDQLVQEAPIKINPKAVPSLWYMPLIGVHRFFDGFGFAGHAERFRRNDRAFPHEPPELERPLVDYLDDLNTRGSPMRYDSRSGTQIPDDDWLLWAKHAEVAEDQHLASKAAR